MLVASIEAISKEAKISSNKMIFRPAIRYWGCHKCQRILQKTLVKTLEERIGRAYEIARGDDKFVDVGEKLVITGREETYRRSMKICPISVHD